jgi:hypothetical protein
MVCVAEPVAPALSVTVRRAAYVAALRYVWEVVTPLPVLPSPKTQPYEMILPSGSDEPAASKLTTRGAAPEVGEAVKEALGATFSPPRALTWIVRVVEP